MESQLALCKWLVIRGTALTLLSRTVSCSGVWRALGWSPYPCPDILPGNPGGLPSRMSEVQTDGFTAFASILTGQTQSVRERRRTPARQTSGLPGCRVVRPLTEPEGRILPGQALGSTRP